MAIEYLGLSEINGPLVALEGVEGASFEEMVEIRQKDERRLGRVVALEGDRAVVQVFDGTSGLGLASTSTRFTGYPMRLALAPEIVGRVFNGAGPVSYTHLDVYKRQIVTDNFRSYLAGQPQNLVT